ncbi:rRNA maturation RNase YbeY [Neopusillimonas aromaticivorans]|jgi:probable rRNA maturation factor|uniref:rRNA maturation RNase YbeY n=1 Tax=Neopusillimonas aromaticivorans TaxID=2979868 RepID=UPI002593DFC9|nr:rRNA maturation RNase YbeY [Neopusillimonas aromaticivorans]WJJ92927.1 rRNA maturation RNase YbeY [Neopusillimonas aromaticivorans]
MPVTTPEFGLSVQYGTAAPELPRWRLRSWLKGAVSYVSKQFELDIQRIEISLRIVDADEGQALNRQFRQKDYATNVLTFEYGTDPLGTLRADIVLCYPVLVSEALAQHKTLQHHAAHLALHGLLHSLGYDHLDDDQASEMEALEIELLDRLHIANPYIA